MAARRLAPNGSPPTSLEWLRLFQATKVPIGVYTNWHLLYNTVGTWYSPFGIIHSKLLNIIFTAISYLINRYKSNKMGKIKD